MSLGTTRLSSESVTVRAVGAEGKIIPPSVKPRELPAQTQETKKPPETPKQPPTTEQSQPQTQFQNPHPQPQPKPQPRSPFDLAFKFFGNAPLRWLIVLALFASSVVAIGLVLLKTPTKEPPEPQEPTVSQELDSGLQFSSKVLIEPGTQQDKQRLRLYPIGRNDIGPWDLLSEDILAVGRLPESEICISNDGQVSAKHCALSPQGKSVLVQDVGSRNGTRVNGVPINGFLHAESDSILGVGRTELRMKLLPAGTR